MSPGQFSAADSGGAAAFAAATAAASQIPCPSRASGRLHITLRGHAVLSHRLFQTFRGGPSQVRLWFGI